MPSTTDLSYFLKSAALLLDHDDTLLARNLYSHILKMDIKNPDALRGLGICLYRLGEVTSSKKCFMALWQLYENHGALVWLGKCHSEEGKEETAIENFLKAQEGTALTKEDTFELYKELGNSYTRLNQLKRAEQSYIKALALKSDSDVIYVNLGTLEIQRNNIDLALKYFDKARTLNPQNEKALCGLGFVSIQKQDSKAAKNFFLDALDINPNNFLAIQQLTTLSHQDKDFGHCKGRILTYLQKNPKQTDARFGLATILFREANWMECEKELDQILKLNPQHTSAQKLKHELQKNSVQRRGTA